MDAGRDCLVCAMDSGLDCLVYLGLTVLSMPWVLAVTVLFVPCLQAAAGGLVAYEGMGPAGISVPHYSNFHRVQNTTIISKGLKYLYFMGFKTRVRPSS